MNKSIVTGIAGLTIGLSVFGVAACLPDNADNLVTPPPVSIPVSPPITPAIPGADSFPTYSLPACAEEDSANCYWDAQSRGNGIGTSFVNLNGTTYYPR